MIDSMFDNLHGVVECYENGVKKWERNNKITTLGRVALLSAMARTEFFWSPEGSRDLWLNKTKWAFDVENSFISMFAVGFGGQTNDNGLPAPARFDDRTLTQIVPILDKGAIDSGSTVYEASNFVDIYGKWLDGEDNFIDTDDLIKNKEYKIQADQAENTIPSTKDYLYFKKTIKESEPTAFSFSSPSTSARYKTGGEIGIKCAIARFRLDVNGGELLTVGGQNSSVAINELSLYIGARHAASDGRQRLFSYAPGVPTEENDSPLADSSKITLPIQFSRVTFPTEVFDSNEKNISFIYNIFA